MTDTSTSADFSSVGDSADTSTDAAPSQADSFDEGDGDYESLPDYGEIDELDEGDADYASLPDYCGQADLDPELSYDELPDPDQADPSTEPQPWAPDETVHLHADDSPGGPPGTSPEVEAARGEVAQAIEQGERQQEARDSVDAAYAQAEADGVPPNTIEQFEAEAQQAIDDAPSTTGAKEVEFEEPGPAKEVEFQDPGIAEEKAATPEAIPEPRLQDGLTPEQPAERGVPEGVPDRSDSQGGDASTPSGDAHPGNSDDWNANDYAIGTPDASNQADAVAHSDASDAAMFDSQVDACVRAADEVGASRESWDGMTMNERADVLADLEASMADATGRPGAEVRFEPLGPGEWGVFNPNTNEMTINADKLADPDNFGELVDTVAHEGRHAYQDFALRNPDAHADKEQLARWADNCEPGRYIRFEDDPEGYRNQPIEADAWDFGARVRAGIEGDE